ncbi:hypothetical protein [Bacillus massiliglaciei]|uniref:hypothetical protein n=1 Tax=Bacillus massiliglaciei TaxID=1816693 RepID=UPI0018FE5D6C|nr:hypothetical protein [Bacillus massiliglaciei]
MTKENARLFMTVGLLKSLLGVFLLFFSVRFGISLGENWLSREGEADTSLYIKVISGYTNSFLACGSILLGAGLLVLCFGYYKLLSRNN